MEILEKYEDQYLVLNLKGKLETGEFRKIEKGVTAAQESGVTNVIVDLSLADKPISSDFHYAMENLQQIVTKESGFLVICCADVHTDEALKNLGITSVPTLSEASDYIFMEEIERQFRESEEETD